MDTSWCSKQGGIYFLPKDGQNDLALPMGTTEHYLPPGDNMPGRENAGTVQTHSWVPLTWSRAARILNQREHLNCNLDQLLEAEWGPVWEWGTPGAVVSGGTPNFLGSIPRNPTRFLQRRAKKTQKLNWRLWKREGKVSIFKCPVKDWDLISYRTLPLPHTLPPLGLQ